MKSIKYRRVISNILTYAALWFIAGCFLGVVLPVLYAKSMAGVWFLGVAGFLSPLALVVFFSARSVDKTINSIYEMKASVLTPKTDYYHVTAATAISVSVQDRTIHLVYENIARGNQSISFSVDKIRNYRAYQPGHSEYDRGFGLIDGSIAAVKTENSKMKAAQETGLTLELDDIMNPEVFIKMPYDAAKKWFLIFDKLADGSLEKQRSAMFFPADAIYAV